MRTITAAAGLVALFLSGAPSVAQVDTACFRAASVSAGAQFGSASMTVARNGRCSHSSTLSDARVDTPPRNGRIEGGTGGFTYIPNPGFAGSDSYVYSGEAAGRRGSRAGASGRVAITVSVSVQ